MIALASDHGGYELKQKVIGYLEANGYTCHDFGCYSLESCDYPEFGRAAAEAVAKGECERESSSVQPVLVFRSLPTRFPVSAADFAQTPIPQK